MWYHSRGSTAKLLNIFPYYYNISDNILKYANYLIKYARYKNVPSRNGFYTKKIPQDQLRKLW